MFKIPILRWLRLRYVIWRNQGVSLQHRFVLKVLAPPFIILSLMSVAGLLQLNSFVKSQAVDDLSRSASSTAAKLEREFSIRQTVLKRTGEDLLKIKNDYQASRDSLNKNREGCVSYVKQKRTFLGAPSGSCDPFLQEFAARGTNLQAIEESYVRLGNQLSSTQEQKIQDRLSAYNQFFPETRALIVANEKNQIVSSAISDTSGITGNMFLPYLVTASKGSMEGDLLRVKDKRLAVFAYAIPGGSALAAYDLASDSFIKQTWESTPIDRSKALVVILDSKSTVAYPNLKSEQNDIFKTSVINHEKESYSQIKIHGIPHIAVGSKAGDANWVVVVASPQAIVFGPLRNAQLAAVIVIGLLLTGFLWVGAIFIQRTVLDIMKLVSGALLFAGGKLDYIIQLPKADQEFKQLAETMNTMAWRIKDAEKQIDEKNKEFISIATHELRTPLTAILGNLSMAVEDFGDKLDGPVKSIIEQAHIGTVRLRDLVNDMLDMARLDGGRVEFVIAEQDIQKVAQDVVNTLQITASERHIKVVYKKANAQPVLADAGKLRIVLNNFVSNAIKYNRQSGSVKIFHTIKDGKLVTAVSDTGLGIPEEQKAHIFEKFFRVASPDRKDVTGTGLGMYITKRYVMAMGGLVWFESVHGQGTTFYFSLPVASQSSNNVSLPDKKASQPPF